MKKIVIMLYLISTLVANATPRAVFVGLDKNDLFYLLQTNGVQVECCDDLNTALPLLGRGIGLFVTAPKYPGTRAKITPDQYTQIAKKGVRMFVEYPSSIPGMKLLAQDYECSLERGIVTSQFFGAGLEVMSILNVNGCSLIPVENKKPIIVMAKVAGFDHAQFGLADTKTYPLLFVQGNVMIATSVLSGFATARFGPTNSWRQVWQGVIRWVTGEQGFTLMSMPVDPHPAFTKDESLTAGVSNRAVEHGTQWLWKAHLFIPPSWEKYEIEKYHPHGGDPTLFFGPPIQAPMLQGDGSRGVMEGHGSTILANGNQLYRYFIRADVQGETAYLLASSAVMNNKSEYNETAEKLLDYLFYTSGFRGKGRDDPSNPAYGLISWANTHLGTFFNDDNARCILGVIGASARMGNQRWNRQIVENILGNLRTSSRQGFQGNALDQKDIEKNGWKYYNTRDFINLHPHFESWMWACYLWLYDKTGYQPLLNKAKIAIRIMMEAYPDRWLSQNGIQQERARMILPLAWLVRVEDTPEHRRWLDTMVSKLLENQQSCGAIREELGNSSSDKNKLYVTSNDAYGKNEASLIARNGDPVADMLYTCNFAFFALNEAVHATGNPYYKEALERLADFLLRIQVCSEVHPDIDGAWFRAFDYERWDYWGSNADNGWGAWSTLTGWIQSWIVSTQVLVARNESYWDMTSVLDFSHQMEASMWMMGN